MTTDERERTVRVSVPEMDCPSCAGKVTASVERLDGVRATDPAPTTGTLRVEYDADETDADMVVMGTHGRTGLDRYATGSVTERVVRLSDVPVFTVRVTDRSVVGDGYDDVLIPTDGSDCAEVAVEHGLAVAERYDATVHAVNIVNMNAVASGADSWADEGVDVAATTDLLDSLETRGENATERVAERAREAGLDAVTEVRDGIPARSLLDYADENDVDLITMGTHGRTGIDRYFLGSTTAKLVRKSEVPLLSVRAPRDAPETDDE